MRFIKALFKALWKLLTPRTLDDVFAPKKISVMGVIFKIKKIDPLSYLDGSQVLLSTYSTYKSGNKEDSETSMKKIRKHQIDVIMAGVVEPKLSRQDDGEGIFVDKLFTDQGLVNELYTRIIEYTYGQKKKSLSSSYRKTN